MGFGKLTDIHLPAEDVVNLNGRVLAVKAAGNQTCALTAGGGVQCWGDNRYGQLGDGTNQKQYEPAQVTGLTAGVTVLADGGNHACAVGSGGELRCWGWNFYGQLGDGTTVNQYAPVRVQYLTDGVTRMALGWGHTCVLIKGGAVKCWGLNGSGQLGDGTWTDSKVPLTVIGVSV
jgi:alpha-tubulin suppressor-like RCC1 family protein